MIIGMRILISGYTGLGNFILKTPMIQRLVELYPNCKIELICGLPWGADEVLKHSDLIHAVHWLPLNASPFRKSQILFQLRNKRFDLVLLPFDSSLISTLGARIFLSQSKVVAHVNLYQRGFVSSLKRVLRLVLLSKYVWVPVLHGRHEIDLNHDLVDSFSVANHTLDRKRKTM